VRAVLGRCAAYREDMTKKLIYSKEIVSNYNIPYSTLTHYTNMGFLHVVEKKGNRRLYDEGEVRARLENIRRLTREGYPLRLIKKVILERKPANELL